jgi:hypothetical protein
MATETTMSARPTGITITASLWIVVGVFMLFSAVMGGLLYWIMRPMDMPGMQAGELPPEFIIMNRVFQNFGVFVGIQCIVALVGIWAGIDLLRLKGWARSAIEVLCWLGVVWTIGFAGYWVYMWISMTGEAPRGAGPIGTFQLMGAIMGVFGMLIFAVPLGMMIRYLRGNQVREAIARATPAGV